MPRRSKADQSEEDARRAGALATLQKNMGSWDGGIIEGLPPPIVDGKPNPEHYRALYATIIKTCFDAMQAKEKPPFNPDSMLRMAVEYTRVSGLDVKTLADNRTDADRTAGALMALLAEPAAMWELPDRELELVEQECDLSFEKCDQTIADIAGRGGPSREEIARAGKKMADRMRRVLRLRRMVRCPGPIRDREFNRRYRHLRYPQESFESSHVLRFMLYVGRSNMPVPAGEDPVRAKVFRIGIHHARNAVGMWMTQNGAVLKNGLAHRKVKKYDTTAIKMPPGHGKSEMVMHALGLRICMRPDTQAIYLHAVVDEAKKNVQYVARMLGVEDEAGRRREALFHVELSARDNTTSTIRVKTARWLKSPTVSAFGVMSARLGTNTDYQVWDDIVPQSDAVEETTRKQRKAQLVGWRSRQRGSDTQIVCIGTVWHHDDALQSLIDEAKNPASSTLVISQAVGGPDSSPAFRPLWPEVYPAARLHALYRSMRNPALWSAAYMGDPRMDSLRIIRKVALYDMHHPRHLDFLRRCVVDCSCDPSATNTEGADKAGIVYAGTGELEVDTAEGTVAYETRLRVLETQQIHATQHELVQHVKMYALQRRIDYIHVETRAAFRACADQFEREIDGLTVFRHDPKNQSKEIRLRSCAGLIDASIKDVGGLGAVVELPGVKNERGELVLYEPMKDLADQILDFGVCAEDHLVDALTQLVNHKVRTGELQNDGGRVTTAVKQALDMTGRDRRLLAQYEQDERELSGNNKKTTDEAIWGFALRDRSDY